MSRPLRILISAGEVSGDLYAAQLVRALMAAAAPGETLDVRAMAGERTRQAGATLLANSASRAALGFVAPLRHLPPSLAAAQRIRRTVITWRPQACVLLDYPGFNIPLAGILRRLGTAPILYYLPPEEWIWAARGNRRLDRTARLVANCDGLLTTHGVDSAFYESAGAKVYRVGHPLLDLVDEHSRQPPEAAPDKDPCVALLPASRRQELRLLWPDLARAAALMARERPELRFLLPLAAAHLRPALLRASAWAVRQYPELAGRLRLVEPTPENPYPALTVAWRAGAALSKSGSVNLELALAGVPHVMAVRIDRITEWIGRHVLKLSEQDFPHVALPNLILGRELIPEFKQHAIDPTRMAATGLALLDPASPARTAQLSGFAELRRALGETGAAARGAEIILERARSQAIS